LHRFSLFDGEALARTNSAALAEQARKDAAFIAAAQNALQRFIAARTAAFRSSPLLDSAER
jgi:hypothetical protein